MFTVRVEIEGHPAYAVEWRRASDAQSEFWNFVAHQTTDGYEVPSRTPGLIQERKGDGWRVLLTNSSYLVVE